MEWIIEAIVTIGIALTLAMLAWLVIDNFGDKL
jgi:hypothetical protein